MLKKNWHDKWLTPEFSLALERQVFWKHPSEWTRVYRPEIDFSGARKPLLKIYNDLSRRIVIKKGVQMFGTEWAMTRALHFLHTKEQDVLYIFPTEANAGDWSSGRFQKLLDHSPFFRGFFTDSDSVFHKRARDVNFYTRGSTSEAQLISVPVSMLVIDEFDRMNSNNLELARDRLQGQKESYELDLSTPTLPGFGIDAEFNKTDQQRLLVECPNCHDRHALSFNSLNFSNSDPEQAHWQCLSCGMPWAEEQKQSLVENGTWVPLNPSAPIRGYHFPGLCSSVRTSMDFAERYFRCLGRGERQVQIFHNSVLGEAYTAEGTRFTDAMIDGAILKGGSRKMESGEPSSIRCAMGVDIGGVHHYAIAYLDGENSRYVKFGTVPRIDDLIPLIHAFNVKLCVVDHDPYAEAVRDLQRKVNTSRYQCLWMARYKDIKVPANWNETKGYLLLEIPRTESLDHVLAGFQQGRIMLPVDVPDEVRLHLRAVVRVNEPDPRTGNPIGRWRETEGMPDHYLHAMNYCEAAVDQLPRSCATVRLSWA